MPKQSFPIAILLTFADTESRMLTSMQAIYEFANFMTGDDLMTHQLPRAIRAIAPELRRQLPFMATPEFAAAQRALSDSLNYAANPGDVVRVWLRDMADHYGANHEVEPLTDWLKQDPVAELVQMRESRNGIVVVKPNPQGGHDVEALRASLKKGK